MTDATTTAPVAAPTRDKRASNIVPKKIRVIGVPLDLGQSRRGVDMGPSAVRVAGLEAKLEALGHVVEEAGNITVAIPEQKKEGSANAKYLKEITATCTKHADLVLKTLEAGKIPIVLGGDHSVAAGTVAGVAEFHRRQEQKIGLICIDVYTMRDIDERGMRAIIEEALRIAGRGTAGYHVSLDMDWIDPEDAPGVGTPVRGGATYREAHLAMEIIADHGRMTSFEIVEVNPVIDEHNQTAVLAVELALSAFGKKIL